ncbi:hypothetical protein DFR58_104161 [Anaerobacterium chartisolvens]|uniref:Uncharacterized protein n=1 Tax=Anaerobacterium chartisolvens TaxID=1297424 RepID=A0A369BBI1_9FIRM|nr:hypothetical protein [Anaerobacterium chartisolvens]RCX18890.1 hypothetical protein DFR58_104161 [Anaerobacterium chartisolvens]
MEESGLSGNQIQEEEWELIRKIEIACKVYRLSEISLSEAEDDYGKLKIARLRLEFSKHHLTALLDEAKRKGVVWENDQLKELEL